MDHVIEVCENFKPQEFSKFFIVDANVIDAHPEVFEGMNPAQILMIAHPEAMKSLIGMKLVLDFFSKNNLTKSHNVCAIGGGALCDLVNFCASIFKRGIESILVPTTLLAMVDAAIGGKTALNYLGTKNLIGSFHEPKKILYCFAFLKTLSQKELLSGFAECLKMALITSKPLWHDLDMKFLTNDLILEFARKKQVICQSDPKEHGLRHVLNFGHTIGHSYEAYFNYDKTHGECVALGMIVESALGYLQGYLGYESFLEIKTKILSIYGSFQPVAFDELTPYMMQDKKAVCGNIRIHSLHAIGSFPELRICNLEDIKKAYELVWM